MPTDNNNKNNNTLHHQTSSSSYIPPGAAAVHQGTPKASAASASPTTYLAPMSGRRILSETFSIGSALSTIDGLHGVYMSKCSLFGIEEDTRISQKLKYFDQTRAREFDFSNIRVGPSFRCVLDALIAAPEIECLVWRRGGLDDGHVEAIVNAARRFIGLQEIDLGENEDISDVGGALLLQLVGGRNNNNNNGDGNGNRNTPMLQKRPPQLVRLDQTNVSFDMQAKINKAISTPILSRPGVAVGQTSPTSPTSRRKSFNHVNTSSNKNKNSNNNNNMTVQQQQQRKNANRSVNQTLKYLMLMSGNDDNTTENNNNMKQSNNGSQQYQLFDDRIHSASIVLSCLMYFHNFLCSILAIALWIPGYRFKTVIYCFCYFVGVALTFGPSSGVIDALAIGMILIGVQRWRHYYAASSQFQQQQMFYSSFLASSSPSSKNNNSQLVVPFSPEPGFSERNNNNMNSTSNFTAQRFQGLSQAARRRWSHFLDPLEELTNILQVANQKRKMVMTSSSKNHNSSNILRRNNNNDDNDDEYQEQQLIFFEQMVRNCTFQYTRFLINTFIILPSPSSTFSSSFTSGSESSGSISSHHLHETRFVLLLTAVVSALLAMVVRLVTGQSAYAVATIFVIFGALYFGSEPFLASSFYVNLFSGVPVSIKPASAVGGRSGLISISSIIKYYRIRIGRWIAGNPVTSAEDAEEAMVMSVTQQNQTTSSSSTSLTTTTTTDSSRRKPPFSFVVEILRIEDAIIKTKSSLNNMDNNSNSNNNTLSIAPLAKIRCMHKSWTSSSADTHYSFSKSTQSCITTSALWHPESSTVFHSPHPYDTAKMEFSIYDCNNNTSNNDDHTNDGNDSNYNHHQHHHHHHHHETSTTTTTNTAVDVLLSGIFLVDDDLVFGEEIAIPLMKNDKINNTSHQISASSSTNNNKGSSSSGVFGGLFGSSAASDGLWSLSHKLLEQIDQRDADERIRHHVPHNSYTNGNHHQHHRSSRSRGHHHNQNHNETSAYQDSPISSKEYLIERPGRLIVKFTEVSSSTSNDTNNNQNVGVSISSRRERISNSSQPTVQQQNRTPPSTVIAPPAASPASYQHQQNQHNLLPAPSAIPHNHVETLDVDDENEDEVEDITTTVLTNADKFPTVATASVSTSKMRKRTTRDDDDYDEGYSSPDIMVDCEDAEIETQTTRRTLNAETLKKFEDSIIKMNNNNTSPGVDDPQQMKKKKVAKFEQYPPPNHHEGNGVVNNIHHQSSLKTNFSSSNNKAATTTTTSLVNSLKGHPRSDGGESEVSIQYLPDEGH